MGECLWLSVCWFESWLGKLFASICCEANCTVVRKDGSKINIKVTHVWSFHKKCHFRCKTKTEKEAGKSELVPVWPEKNCQMSIKVAQN